MGRFKVPIAGDSRFIVKFCIDEAVHFSPKMHVYE